MTIFTEQLHTLLENSPDQTVIYFRDSKQPDLPITYRLLMRGANAYAKTYLRQHIKPGEVIILILEHSEDLIY